MKKVHVIGAFIEGLTTIKLYLSELNIFFSEFKTAAEAIQSGEVPDLLIFFTDRNSQNTQQDIDFLKNSPSFARVPRIFILPYLAQTEANSSDIIDGQCTFQLPVDKLKFLSVVSTFLKRAQRRVFRIVITLQPEGSNIRYSGLSMDFSKTGMAFECISDLPVGDLVKVQFVNPRSRNRFLLKAEIVRKASTQADGTTFYGVRFIDLSIKDTIELTNFITGETL